MCESKLLVDKKHSPIEIANGPHYFEYVRHGKTFQLLDGIEMSGIINYAAAHEIRDSYGVSRGYMFILGESAGSPNITPTDKPKERAARAMNWVEKADARLAKVLHLPWTIEQWEKWWTKEEACQIKDRGLQR